MGANWRPPSPPFAGQVVAAASPALAKQLPGRSVPPRTTIKRSSPDLFRISAESVWLANPRSRPRALTGQPRCASRRLSCYFSSTIELSGNEPFTGDRRTFRRDAQLAWLASRAAPAEAVPQPPQTGRTRDLSGELAAARREAREQWIAQRDAKTATPAVDAVNGQGREPTSPKLILPDDDRTLQRQGALHRSHVRRAEQCPGSPDRRASGRRPRLPGVPCSGVRLLGRRPREVSRLRFNRPGAATDPGRSPGEVRANPWSRSAWRALDGAPWCRRGARDPESHSRRNGHAARDHHRRSSA